MSITSPTKIKSAIAAAMCICSYSTDSSLRSHLGGGMWHLLWKHTSPSPFTPFISSFLLLFLFRSFFLDLLDSRSNCRENIWNNSHILFSYWFIWSHFLWIFQIFLKMRWGSVTLSRPIWKNEITFLSNAPDFRENIAVLEIIQTSPAFP
jgi:hypothetical protein